MAYADKVAEVQLGEPYAKARDRAINGLYRALVAFFVLGLIVFTLLTCVSSMGRNHGDCDWTSHGEICGPRVADFCEVSDESMRPVRRSPRLERVEIELNRRIPK